MGNFCCLLRSYNSLLGKLADNVLFGEDEM